MMPLHQLITAKGALLCVLAPVEKDQGVMPLLLGLIAKN